MATTNTIDAAIAEAAKYARRHGNKVEITRYASEIVIEVETKVDGRMTYSAGARYSFITNTYRTNHCDKMNPGEDKWRHAALAPFRLRLRRLGVNIGR